MVMPPSDPTRDARDAGEIEQRAKSLFDESVERLDGQTRSKLTRARQAALDELKHQRARPRWLAHPLGGLTAAALVAVVVLMWPGVVRTPTGPGAEPRDDLEIVANGDEIEMLQDVEFYAWLDEK
jgi:hypothetical protein